MKDQYNRNINYMRISITDRCNLRCRYCMPQGIKLLPMSDILTYEEILSVCREAVSLGITRFKITGGEPLVRKGCTEFIAQLKQLPGVEQVTLTTNGILLEQYLHELIMAGLDAVNVSLDTTDPDIYREITGFDRYYSVINSIMACVEAGIPTKINCVLQQGMNIDNLQDILVLARDNRLDVRFIELMPIGEGDSRTGLANTEVIDRISCMYPEICKDESIHGNGPAAYYHIPGWKGSIGFISAMHGRFCDQCNRIRMTSTGEIKSCLCYDGLYNIRAAVRENNADEVRSLLYQAVYHKPQMHCFDTEQDITEHKKMAQIGG